MCGSIAIPHPGWQERIFSPIRSCHICAMEGNARHVAILACFVLEDLQKSKRIVNFVERIMPLRVNISESDDERRSI